MTKSRNGDSLDKELAALNNTINMCNPIHHAHQNDWFHFVLTPLVVVSFLLLFIRKSTKNAMVERDIKESSFGMAKKDQKIKKPASQDEEIARLVSQISVRRSKTAASTSSKYSNSSRARSSRNSYKHGGKQTVWKPKKKQQLTSNNDDNKLEECIGSSFGFQMDPTIFAKSEEELCGYENFDAHKASDNDISLPDCSTIKPSPKIPRAQQSSISGIIYGVSLGSTVKSSTDHASFQYSDEMKLMNREKDLAYFRRRDKYSEYVEARARFSKMHSVT